MKLDAVLAASKKFFVAREAVLVFPSIPAFSRLIDAMIELQHAIDPEEKEPLGVKIASRLLLFALTVVGDVTLFWKRWR